MSNIQPIPASSLVPIEHEGQRVITLAMMDSVHGRPDGTARRTFNASKDKLVDGRHYFVWNPSEAARKLGTIAPNGLTVLTERGYLILVKSFTDALAWKVQEDLVDGYFRAKAGAAVAPADMVSVASFDRLVEVMMDRYEARVQRAEERLDRRFEMLSERQHKEWLAASHMAVAHGLTVGELAKEFGIKGVPGLAVRMSNRLVRCGCQLESGARAHAGNSKAKLFHPDKSRAVMKAGFADDCRRYVSERRGKGALPFGLVHKV